MTRPARRSCCRHRTRGDATRAVRSQRRPRAAARAPARRLPLPGQGQPGHDRRGEAAVADIKGVRLSGFFAWAAWLVVHPWYLIGFQNRLLILIRWSVQPRPMGEERDSSRALRQRASWARQLSCGPFGSRGRRATHALDSSDTPRRCRSERGTSELAFLLDHESLGPLGRVRAMVSVHVVLGIAVIGVRSVAAVLGFVAHRRQRGAPSCRTDSCWRRRCSSRRRRSGCSSSRTAGVRPTGCTTPTGARARARAVAVVLCASWVRGGYCGSR